MVSCIAAGCGVVVAQLVVRRWHVIMVRAISVAIADGLGAQVTGFLVLLCVGTHDDRRLSSGPLQRFGPGLRGSRLLLRVKWPYSLSYGNDRRKDRNTTGSPEFSLSMTNF